MGKKTNRRTTDDAGDSGARARTTTTTTPTPATTTRARFSSPVVAMVERVEDATMPTTLDADYVVVRAEEAASAIRAHALACYDVAFASMVEVDGEASPERVFAAFARASRELARRRRAEGGGARRARRWRRRWRRFVEAARCGRIVARVVMNPMTRRAVVLAWVWSGKATMRAAWGMW